MITFLICWFLIVFIHAYIYQTAQEKVERVIYDSKVDDIAFMFWHGSLGKSGLSPRKPNGAWMNMWEVYNYWRDGNVDKTPWVNHTLKYLQ